MNTIEVICSRCGTAAPSVDLGKCTLVPRGWEGTLHQAVCPGCQYVEWHPFCQSLRAEYGHEERVEIDLEARARGEAIVVEIGGIPIVLRPDDSFEELHLGRCEYLDLSVSWIEDDDYPREWRCAECGGTKFIGAHRDSARSGMRGTAFDTAIEDEGA